MTAALPALSVLFAVLATAVPWGLPGDATFILPLVVVSELTRPGVISTQWVGTTLRAAVPLAILAVTVIVTV